MKVIKVQVDDNDVDEWIGLADGQEEILLYSPLRHRTEQVGDQLVEIPRKDMAHYNG